jgi:hypothetical protein
MKTALIISVSLFFGLNIGAALTYRSATNQIKRVNVEATAKKVVADMQAAYESQLETSGVIGQFQDKLEKCAKSNEKLNKRVWALENPRPLCGDSGLCKGEVR